MEQPDTTVCALPCNTLQQAEADRGAQRPRGTAAHAQGPPHPRALPSPNSGRAAAHLVLHACRVLAGIARRQVPRAYEALQLAQVHPVQRVQPLRPRELVGHLDPRLPEAAAEQQHGGVLGPALALAGRCGGGGDWVTEPSPQWGVAAQERGLCVGCARLQAALGAAGVLCLQAHAAAQVLSARCAARGEQRLGIFDVTSFFEAAFDCPAK